MGVGTLILANAAKVEKDYWGSHLIRHPKKLEMLLRDGLAQSGDVNLPTVILARRLKPFLEDDLDRVLPPEGSRRLLAHPYPVASPEGLERAPVAMRTVAPPECGGGKRLPVSSGSNPTAGGTASAAAAAAATVSSPGRILIAAGPEGGWADFEVGLLGGQGFAPVGLGPRVLRSDVAVASLLALAHSQVDAWDCGQPSEVRQ
mmetsp:Transcript_51186/g.116364  ORF Transcript_51186/g.116364 Transcript_51186/m.116364 type:complete len:203 (+) Transcript_51186:394-1002(+)